MAELSKSMIKKFGGSENADGQWLFRFPNGYTASVVNYGYGGNNGFFEILVFKTESRQSVDDAEGWLDEEEIKNRLLNASRRKPITNSPPRRREVRVRSHTKRSA